MPIPVTCPSCLTRFSVSDKFAGKSGPCPKCKTTIKIPEPSEQVVIHAPVDSGPKGRKGQSIFKPIRREEVKLSLPVILSVVIGSIVVFSLSLGFPIPGSQPPAVLLAMTALLLACPIVFAGYWFLRDEDLQGFSGRELLVRCGICAAVFAIGWALYRFIPAYVSGHSSVAETRAIEMVLMFAVMIGIGTAAAVLALELEIAQGLLLYMLYFLITFVLVWVSGAPLGEFLPRKNSSAAVPTMSSPPSSSEVPGRESTANQATPSSANETPGGPPPRDIPKLLQ